MDADWGCGGPVAARDTIREALDRAPELRMMALMPALPAYARIPVDAYLAGEVASETKHDYVDGAVFAMAGGTVRHNRIASNVLGSLHGQLRGNPCRPFNSDMKIRIRMPSHTRFYYPDLSIVCQSNPDTEDFQDQPAVIVEVLSGSTRRADQGEKKDAYLTIPSLCVYIMVEADATAAVVFRRGAAGFEREVYEGEEAVIELPEVRAALPLAEVYESAGI